MGRFCCTVRIYKRRASIEVGSIPIFKKTNLKHTDTCHFLRPSYRLLPLKYFDATFVVNIQIRYAGYAMLYMWLIFR